MAASALILIFSERLNSVSFPTLEWRAICAWCNILSSIWIRSLSFPSRSGRTWSRSVMRTTRRSCAVWFTATWPPHGRRCRAQTRPRWKIWTTCAKISPNFAMRWGTCWASGPPNMPCSTQGAKKDKICPSLSPLLLTKPLLLVYLGCHVTRACAKTLLSHRGKF